MAGRMWIVCAVAALAVVNVARGQAAGRPTTPRIESVVPLKKQPHEDARETIWYDDFGGGEKPRTASVKDSVGEFEDFADLAVARPALDARIIAWAEALTAETIAGDITWWSGINKANVSRPAALIFTHFFNHQTHHRGQAHALLTIAGTKPDDTDLIYMPGVAG